MARPVVHWEIGGRDLDRLATFYEQLFGWKPLAPDPDYRLILSEEGIGGGLLRCHDDMAPYVTIYVDVDDLSEALAHAEDLGGTALVPPTPIPGVGAFALFSDPEGNTVGLLATDGPPPAT